MAASRMDDARADDARADGAGAKDCWWAGAPPLVISGVSGRFPEADNVGEFGRNLMDKVDMVTEDDRRWPPGTYGLPARHGKLRDLEHFDAGFFGITPRQAHCTDPTIRLLHEVVYEALVDSGYDPQRLRSSRTGVFVGASLTESGALATSLTSTEVKGIDGYMLFGSTLSMFSNRLSFSFDFRGPSFTVDTACSSSLLALQLAIDSIRRGECSQAVVCGAHVTLSPSFALHFTKMNMTSPTGTSRSFDAAANGYVRSEAVGAVFVQKEADARRIYCRIVNAKSNTDGYKAAGITVPSGERQAALLREVYAEAQVDPGQVEYVEAHGTGTPVGDPMEANGLTSVLCVASRSAPLLLGSVKSNMGHAEPASGVCSLAKLMFAFQRGLIPPNLHFNEPNPNIPALLDGRMKVVTDATQYNGGLVGINSFGYGGANTHILVRGNDDRRTADMLPQNQSFVAKDGSHLSIKLITYCARMEEGVRNVYELIASRPMDTQLQALIANVACQPTSLCPFRGFALVHSDGRGAEPLDVKKVPVTGDRPLCFVYSGMGAQWPGMAKGMMRLRHFKRSVEACAAVLQPMGIDLVHMMQTADEATYKENTLNCMLAITAVQIALTDMLVDELGLQPDHIVGHSTGEMACGYADGGLTRQQTMLLAYYRGKAVLDYKLNGTGAMASIGLPLEDVRQRLPQDVCVACHNSWDNVTVSGSAAGVQLLLEQCQREEVFARPVDSSGVPFHSPAMQVLKPTLQQHFAKVIPNSACRPRSTRWISTSVPDDEARIDFGNLCSAEYFMNNVLSPVLFHEAIQKLTENTVAIEVAPKGILRAILRRSLAPAGGVAVPLLAADVDDEFEHFLRSLGQLYQTGVQVRVERLFAAAQFPVAADTPMLGDTLRWLHDTQWTVPDTIAHAAMESGPAGNVRVCAPVSIDPYSEGSEDAYLLDHVIDGRVLLPFTAFIHLVWQAIGSIKQVHYETLSVVFEDFSVLRPTFVTQKLVFDVIYHSGDGLFEVYERHGEVIANGHATVVDSARPFYYKNLHERYADDNSEMCLSNDDVYKEIRLRGYEYKQSFKGIHCATVNGSRGYVRWLGHWPAFLDCVLQTALLPEKQESLRLPTRLGYLRIDAQRLLASLQPLDGFTVVPVFNDLQQEGAIAAGVEYRDLRHQSTAVKLHAMNKDNVIVEKCEWAAYFENNCMSSPLFVKEQQQLQAYSRMCERAFEKLAHTLRNADERFGLLDGMSKCGHDENIETEGSNAEIEGTDSEKYSLLALLNYVHETVHLKLVELNQEPLNPEENPSNHLESLAECMIEKVQQLYSALANDILWQVAISQRPLKTVTDALLENSAGSKIRMAIAEPTGHKVPLVKAVSDICNTHPQCTFEWSAVGADQDQLDQELAQLYDVMFVHWDDCEGGLCDGAFVNLRLHLQKDPVKYAEAISKILRPDGFLNLIVPNGNLTQLMYFVEQSANPEVDKDILINGIMHGDQMVHSIAENLDMEIVAVQTDPVFMSSLYMLHKRLADPPAPMFLSIDDVEQFSWLEPLKAEAARPVDEHQHRRVWLLNQHTACNGGIQLARTLRAELRDTNRYRCVDAVEFDERDGFDLAIDGELMADCLQRDMHTNVYDKDRGWGRWNQYYIAHDELFIRGKREHVMALTTTRGDLNSLSWHESPLQHDADRPDIVDVCYVAMNFRDVMLATGALPPEANLAGNNMLFDSTFTSTFGTEYAGVLRGTGRRVLCTAHAFAMATSVDTEQESFVASDIADELTMEEAVTIPIAYITAYYGMVLRGKLSPGESVLVHSGSGGVGLAAIRLALHLNCAVYTTVGSDAKRHFVQGIFPQLRDEHFASSRTTDFEYHIMNATGGRGVDLVLNSLTGEKLQASLRCVARSGRFVEIGKYDMFMNRKIGMDVFRRNIGIEPIIVDIPFEARRLRRKHGEAMMTADEKDMETTYKWFADMRSVALPLPATVFNMDQIQDAFRYMAAGKHMGKVLLKIRDEPPRGQDCAPVLVECTLRTTCHPKHVYLITGGLGGFGLEVAHFLVKRGARRLVLTSRSGVKTGYQKRCLYFWRRYGVQVDISNLDVCRADECDQLVSECTAGGSTLGGVFHLALVLNDSMLEQQTVEWFHKLRDVKLTAAQNLDSATRRLCAVQPRWFVAFSSVSAARGNMGQANYAWANGAMERLLQRRRAAGMHALSIQWGAVGDVGVVIDTLGSNDTVVGGTLPLRLLDCLRKLDAFLTWSDCDTVCAFLRADTKVRQRAERRDVADTIAAIIGMKSGGDIDPGASLTSLGIDSLMGVELKQALEHHHNIVLTMKDIKDVTVDKLRDLEGKISRVAKPAAPGETAVNGTEDKVPLTENNLQNGPATSNENVADTDEDTVAQERMRSMFRVRVDTSANETYLLKVVECNIDYDAPPLVWLLHPIEGLMDPIKGLVSALPLRTLCLQATQLDLHQSRSLQTMAQVYWQWMKERQPQGPYTVVGYSFGACVAFEMAHMIHSEAPHPDNKFIMIDGSPDYVKKFTQMGRFMYDSAVGAGSLLDLVDFQLDYLCGFVDRFHPSAVRGLRAQLAALPHWDARLGRTVQLAMTGTWARELFVEDKNFELFARGVVGRMDAMDSYEPSSGVAADLVLVRVTDSLLRDAEFGADYGLSKYTSGRVRLQRVAGDHDAVVSGGAVSKQVAQLIADIVSNSSSEPAPTPHKAVQNSVLLKDALVNGHVHNGF